MGTLYPCSPARSRQHPCACLEATPAASSPSASPWGALQTLPALRHQPYHQIRMQQAKTASSEAAAGKLMLRRHRLLATQQNMTACTRPPVLMPHIALKARLHDLAVLAVRQMQTYANQMVGIMPKVLRPTSLLRSIHEPKRQNRKRALNLLLCLMVGTPLQHSQARARTAVP